MSDNEYKVSLSAARINAGLTQLEASKKIGISKSTLFKYESGKTFPTVPTLKRICQVYKVPIESISFAQMAK